jgi:integrase
VSTSAPRPDDYLSAVSARAFDDHEISALSRHFTDNGNKRDRLLLLIGVTCGLRIREILSITVADLWDGREAVQELYIQRARLKGGRSVKRRAIRGRRIPLAENVRLAIASHLADIGTADPTRAVFASRQSHGRPMTQFQCWRRLREACAACRIDLAGVSTHSYRKSFAQAFYGQTKDLLLTQTAMGHANPLTTAAYLKADQGRADQIIRELASRLAVPSPPPALPTSLAA